MRQPTEEIFLKDVAKHQMRVLHNDGLYRHLRFSQPENSNHWFEIITWPDCLTIYGDMHTWTFSRIEDMFNFFRCSRGGLGINPHYWSEKLQTGEDCGIDSAKEFDAGLFRGQALKSLEDYDLDPGDLATVKQALEDDVFTGEKGEHFLTHRLYEFECQLDSGSWLRFNPEDVPDGKDRSYHFLWCLYAIVWGIRQWDAREK